ncbi:MAG: zinc ribbon domain-containing protein [Burkholderiales bacterium]
MTHAPLARPRAASVLARLAFLLLALLLVPVFAFAQAPAKGGGARLSSLSIEIWPEYDRPAALVILRGTVAEDVKLPAAITLRLPAGADGAAAVAYAPTQDGNLLNLKNEQVKGKDGVTVKFETPTRFFHIEFYEKLPTTDPARSYSYTWLGDLPVEKTAVVVQEPAGALGLVTEPPFNQTSQGADGLNYRIGDLGALAAGKPATIKINYTKADARPSVEIRGMRTAQAAPTPAPSAPPGVESISAPVPPAQTGLPNWAVPVGGFAMFGIIVALVVALMWRRQAGAPAAAAQPSTQGGAKFCRKCGAPLVPDSAFCAKCGTKVAAG